MSIHLVRHSLRAALSWVIVLGLALPAQADPDASWSQSFPAAAVGSYLDQGTEGIIVVAAGTAADAATAADALEAAFRATGAASLVMNDDGLGNVVALDDATIVGKAAHLPVSVIAVVRVFPAQEGASPRVVVTLYDKSGTVQAAFSTEQGVPVASRAGETSSAPKPSEGVSEKTIEAIIETQTRATGAGEEERHQQDEAKRRYGQEYIWFEDGVTINATTGQVHSRWTVPYQGKHKRPLSGADFYEALERPDLAGSYRKRTVLRVGLYAGGLAAALAGTVLWTKGSLAQSPYDECIADFDRTYLECQTESREVDGSPRQLGIGLMMVGAGAVVGAWLVDAHPISAHEARQLADEHNQALREQLGLSEDQVTRRGQRARTRRIAWRAAPFATAGGGGIVIDGRF